MSITATQLISKVNVIGAAEAEARLLGVGDASDAAGGKLKMLAVGGLALAGAALIGIGVASVKMAGDFEQGLTSLVTGAGESDKKLKLISDGILAMSVKTGTSTKDLIAGMYMIESAGFHGAAGLAVLQAAAEGAKVGAADLADVANGVTTAMVDYATAHLSAADATNTLIAAVSLGKTHLGDLSAALAHVLPTAAAAGVSFAEVAAAMATMTAEGTPAADAATYLRQMLIGLEAPGSKASKTLAEIGLSSSQVALGMRKSPDGLITTLEQISEALAKKFPASAAIARAEFAKVTKGQETMDQALANLAKNTSPAYVEALKNIAGGSKNMQALLELTSGHMGVFRDNLTAITDAVLKGAGGITGWNRVQEDFNFQMDKAKAAVEAVFITIGLKLLPVLTPLVAHITALLIPFATWIASGHAVEDSMKWLGQNVQIAGPILAGLAAILLAVVVPAMATTAIATFAALWPFLAIGAAVAGVAAALIYAYQHWTGFREVVNTVAANLLHFWSILQTQFIPTMQRMIAGFLQFARDAAPYVWQALQMIGGFLTSNFMPVWNQLVSVVQNQLIPAWNSLVSSLMPLMPTLKQVGMVIGGILVVAVGLLISVLGGLISMFVAILKGVIQIVGGLIQIWTGAFTVIIGLVSFFVDLFTGHWERLGNDLHAILSGLGQMFMGALNVIFGLVNATFGAILAFISGFAKAFVGFFTWIWHMLVGGSIIPDMVNGIIGWFTHLVSTVIGSIRIFIDGIVARFTFLRAMAIAIWLAMIAWVEQHVAAFISNIKTAIGNGVQNLIDTFTKWGTWLNNFFGGLPAKMLQFGINLIQGFIDGVRSMLGNVGSAIGDVWSTISSFFPQSPPKQGPGVDLPNWGPRLVHQFAEGIKTGIPQIQAAVNLAVAPIARFGAPSSSGSFAGIHTPYAFPSMQAAAPTIVINVQSPDMVVDGHRLAGVLMPGIVRQIRSNTGVRF